MQSEWRCCEFGTRLMIFWENRGKVGRREFEYAPWGNEVGKRGNEHEMDG